LTIRNEDSIWANRSRGNRRHSAVCDHDDFDVRFNSFPLDHEMAMLASDLLYWPRRAPLRLRGRDLFGRRIEPFSTAICGKRLSGIQPSARSAFLQRWFLQQAPR